LKLKEKKKKPTADSFLIEKHLVLPGAESRISISSAVISTLEFWKGQRQWKRKRSKSYERHNVFKGTVMRSAEKLLICALLLYFQYIL
jgi:ribosomal protein L19